MGVWDKIERAVHGVAEGIGKKFEQGAALPGKGANWVKGGGLSHALGRMNQMHGFGGRVKNTAGVLASMIGGGPKAGLEKIAQQQGLGQKPAGGGFVRTPREYVQNLRHAARQFGAVAGPAAGRGLQRVGGGLRSLLGSGTAATGASSPDSAGPRKINEQFKKMAGPQGLPLITKLFAALGAMTALRGAVELFKRFTFGIADANRDLAKWNGALAASVARMDIQSMRLNIQTANATAGGASKLNEAITELRTEFQPIREDVAKILNVVGIMGVNALKTALVAVKAFAANNDLLKGLLDAADEMEKAMKKNQNNQFPGNQALEAIARLPAGGLPGAGPQQNHDVGRAQGAFVNHPGRRRLR